MSNKRTEVSVRLRTKNNALTFSWDLGKGEGQLIQSDMNLSETVILKCYSPLKKNLQCFFHLWKEY